jgi:hypothetical protein
LAQPAIKRQPELMIFHIRRKDGSIDPFSAGPYVDGDNRSMHRQRVGQAPVFRSFGPKLTIHRRYTERPLLRVPYGSVQGVTVRPVPCNYYVIQQDIALSRRKHGFKSRRGRQIFQQLASASIYPRYGDQPPTARLVGESRAVTI